MAAGVMQLQLALPWPASMGCRCKVENGKIDSNLLPHLAQKKVLKKTRELFNVTFDQIYSNICELCDHTSLVKI